MLFIKIQKKSYLYCRVRSYNIIVTHHISFMSFILKMYKTKSEKWVFYLDLVEL